MWYGASISRLSLHRQCISLNAGLSRQSQASARRCSHASSELQHLCDARRAVAGHDAQPLRCNEQCRPIIGRSPPSEAGEREALQPGRQLVAAAYALYSSATMVVLSLGAGAHGFTLDAARGEFVLTHPRIRVPARGARRDDISPTVDALLFCLNSRGEPARCLSTVAEASSSGLGLGVR